jgi:hypothetical protein
MSLAFKQLDSRDTSITPFKAYKSWEYTTVDSIDSASIKRILAIKPDTRNLPGHIETNINSQSLYWYNLNHVYYSEDSPFYINNNRSLYVNANVIAIPQSKIGEGIKPGSVSFSYVNDYISSETVNLLDDGKGNLIDTKLSQSISNEIMNINFHAKAFESNYINPINSFNDVPSGSKNYFDIVNVSSNSKKISAVAQNTYVSYRNGYYSLQLSSGYIRVANDSDFSFVSDKDFSLSFWMYKKDNIASSYVVSKRTTAKTKILSKGKISIQDFNQNVSKYPFDICFSDDANSLIFSTSDGSSISNLSASCLNNTEEAIHVVYQKLSGSMQLYVNGTLSSTTLAPSGNLNNEADIFFGSLGLDANGNTIRGAVCGFADIFLFDKGLTGNEVKQLSTRATGNDMTTNRNTVGNIFYEHGIIVLSDTRRIYDQFDEGYLFRDTVPGFGDRIFSSPVLKWNSTVTLYEHEYICKLREDEFNSTSNSTVRLNNVDSSDVLKPVVTNKDFTPYITTVGLYNDKGDLLVVGKLGMPIKKRDDVQLNILIRFDI